MAKITALPGSFMIMSIIGFFISVLAIYHTYPSYGVAFALVFLLMFVASIISMTKADIRELEYIENKKNNFF